jgi:hypothetical protein
MRLFPILGTILTGSGRTAWLTPVFDAYTHPIYPTPYDDGGSYTIATFSDSVVIRNATTFTLASTGTITGLPTDLPDAISSCHGIDSLGGNTLSLDGTVTGGLVDAADGGANGVQSIEDTSVTITGGSYIGGDDPASGGSGLVLLAPDAAAISGGTFTGGPSTAGPGGTGAAIGLSGTETATISGGTFSGGSGGSGGSGDGYALGVAVADSSMLTVSGGTFSDDIAMNISGSGIVRFTGSGLTYSGGVLSGTLTDSTAISVTVVNLGASLTTTGSTSVLDFIA